MFVEDGEEGAFEELPCVLNGGDEVESVPVHQGQVVEEGLFIEVFEKSFTGEKWGAFIDDAFTDACNATVIAKALGEDSRGVFGGCVGED